MLHITRMYVARVPNRSSPPAILLRESFRQDGKVKSRTLANLTSWPPERIQAPDRFQTAPARWRGSASVESVNNKARVVTRRSYGFRTYKGIELALYYTLERLPEPETIPRFC